MQSIRVSYPDIPQIGSVTSEMEQSAINAIKIKDALVAARIGTASLAQLGEAHDIAAMQGLKATVAELQDAIRAKLPIVNNVNGARKAAMRNLAVGVGLGVVAGIGTHFVLVGLGERSRGGH